MRQVFTQIVRPCSKITVFLSTLVGLLSFSLSSIADVYGSQDLSGFKRFPGSEIVDYTAPSDQRYRLILSAIKDINRRVVADNEQRLSARVTRVTYRLGDSYLPEDGLEDFRQQLVAKGAEKRFECQGRGCGRSNSWANQIFRIAKLYGPDRDQRYEVWSLSQADKVNYWVMYGIRRGNKRVYLHIDQVESQAVQAESPLNSAQAIRQLLQTQGYVSLASPDAMPLPLLASALQQFSSNEPIWVVGQRGWDSQQDLQTTLSGSKADAEAFLKKLQEAGIAIEQLQSFGIGPLAPGFNAGQKGKVGLTIILPNYLSE